MVTQINVDVLEKLYLMARQSLESRPRKLLARESRVRESVERDQPARWTLHAGGG
jgi:hypothetical protein